MVSPSGIANKKLHHILQLLTPANWNLASCTAPRQRLSLRTSDRCHWCGNPFSFLTVSASCCVKRCGLPRQCAHWLAMTYWTAQARKNRACSGWKDYHPSEGSHCSWGHPHKFQFGKLHRATTKAVIAKVAAEDASL